MIRRPPRSTLTYTLFPYTTLFLSDGVITYYNAAAVELSGREPTLGHDKWCTTWRLHSTNGAPLPHDECPMAVALKEQRPVTGEEAIAERPDGSRVRFAAYPTPLFDAEGQLSGAVNMQIGRAHV